MKANMKAYILIDKVSKTPSHVLLTESYIRKADIEKVIKESLEKRNEDDIKTGNAESESWYIDKGLEETFKENVKLLDFSEIEW